MVHCHAKTCSSPTSNQWIWQHLHHAYVKPATYLRQGSSVCMQVLTQLHKTTAKPKSPQLAMQSSLEVMKYLVYLQHQVMSGSRMHQTRVVSAQ